MRVIKLAVLFFIFSITVFAQNSVDDFQLKGKFFFNSTERIVSYDFLDNYSKIRLIGDRTIRIWDVEKNESLEMREHGIENLTPLRFGGISPDKTKLLVLGLELSDGKKNSPKAIIPAKVYDIETGKFLAVLDKGVNFVRSAIWSKDGKTLITADNPLLRNPTSFHQAETEIGFWDGETYDFRSSVNIKDINWFYLSEDGNHFFTASAPKDKVLFIPVNGMTNVINILDTQTAQNVKNLSVGDENFHTYPAKLMTSPDGKYLALVSKNKETDDEHRIMVWRLGGGKTPEYIIPANPKIRDSKLKYSSDGKYFALDSGKDTQIYELKTGIMTAEIKGFDPPDFWLDDNRIALYNLFKSVKAVKISSGATVYENPLVYIEETSQTTKSTTDAFGNYETETTTTVIDSTKIVPSPNGKYFLTYSNVALDVFNSANGQKLKTLEKSPPITKKKVKVLGISIGKIKIYPEKTIKSAEWSADSRMIVIQDIQEGIVYVWEVQN